MKEIYLGDKLTYAQILSFISNFSEHIIQTKDQLNLMDANCGDGDFGTSMYVAFDNVRKAMEKQQKQSDVGILLSSAGYSILSSTGGASGALFGTFFIEAGKYAKGKTELNLFDLSTMFDLSLKKIQTRGGAKVGDKTLVDSLEPGVKALQEAAATGSAFEIALERSAAAAEMGAQSTKSMVANQGKSRYLGEQTLGYVDPGAFVMALVFRILAISTTTYDSVS